MKNWWNHEHQKLSFASYLVNSTTEVMVGSRPDYAGTSQDFANGIEGWINVSDRLVRYPPGVRAFWFPWNESGAPSLELVFSCLKTLDYWINELKIKRIYIHCDGGTHRAVSLFGLYLLAYQKDNAEKIVGAYNLVGRTNWSNPLEYAEGYLKELKELQCVIEEISKTVDTDTHGHSLEDFLKYSIGENKLSRYRWDRYMKTTLPLAFRNSVNDFRIFIKYNLIVTPFNHSINWIHKKLNTEKGKELKRHKL